MADTMKATSGDPVLFRLPTRAIVRCARCYFPLRFHPAQLYRCPDGVNRVICQECKGLQGFGPPRVGSALCNRVEAVECISWCHRKGWTCDWTYAGGEWGGLHSCLIRLNTDDCTKLFRGHGVDRDSAKAHAKMLLSEWLTRYPDGQERDAPCTG